MKAIAITGGIGTGKSTVAEMIACQGVPLIDSDDLARQVVAPSSPAAEEILAAFGPSVFSESGALRRDELAKIVFNDVDARLRLEAITHPRIQGLWRRQLSIWKASGAKRGVVVIPLLFEIKAEVEFDLVLCTACSIAAQRTRLLARGWSEAECAQRISAQWPVEVKIARAHHVIWTEGKLEVTRAQVQRLFAD